MNPQLSIILPVWNAERYVQACLYSIQRQTFQDFECIIIDDGSTDGTPDILASFVSSDQRFCVIQQSNAGMTKALNAGIKVATGRYIARMDADDICFPERLDRQLAFLDAHCDVGVVGSQVLLIDADGDPVCVMDRPLEHAEIDAIHLSGIGGGIVHPTAMIRRSVLDQVGGYDTRWRVSQDLDLWLRIAERSRLSNLSDVLLAYRLHPASTALTQAAQQRECAAAILTAARQRRGIDAEVETNWDQDDLSNCFQKMLWRSLHGENYATARKYAWRLFLDEKCTVIGMKALCRAFLLLGKRNRPEDMINLFES